MSAICPLSGVKRTWLRDHAASAYDPKRALMGLDPGRESEANPPYDSRSELGRQIAVDLETDAHLDKS